MSDAFSVQKTMLTLGYHSKWLEYGFIDGKFLRQQFEFYRASRDQSPEHYRYAAFNVALERHQPFDDARLTQYVELAEIDSDKMMANAALADLLRWPGVSPAQFLRLSALPIFAEPSLQRIIRREEFRREIQASNFSEELFTKCLDSDDATIHRMLLQKTELTRAQLTALRDKTGSKAVKNIANDKLGK